MDNPRSVKNTAFPIGLVLLVTGLFLSLLSAGIISCLSPRQYPLPLLAALVLLALLLSVGLLLYFIFAVLVPQRLLQRAEEGPVLKEIDRLKTLITEVSRGNLSIRTADTASNDGPGASDRLTASEIFTPLGQAHRTVIATIDECAREFKQVTAPPCRRILYVGADSFLEGKKCGRLLGRALGGRGRVGVIMGDALASHQSLRKKGFQAALLEEFPDIAIVAEEEDKENNELSPRVTREMLASHPDLDGIYVTQGATPHTVARTAAEAGSRRRVQIVTHDLTPATMECIADGLITGTLSQNPLAQGFDPVIELYNHLVSGELPLLVRRLTILEEVTRDNIADHWDTVHGQRLSDAARGSLSRPVPNPAGKRVKIGVILPADTGFWEPVAAGVRQAEEVLLRYYTVVTPVMNEATRRMDWSAAAFEPVIMQLIDDGCQGVCLPVFDPALVSFINRKTEEGIAFATFNAEPVSLRGMIDSVNRHAEHLFQVSEGLAAHATENSQAVNQITATMKLLLVGSLNQIQHLSRTDDLIQSLIGLIARVREETNEGITTADATKRTAQSGYQIVRRTQEVMTALDRNARITNDAINALNANVMKINEITRFIDDLTAQTNLLAINASIQASQAGERGRGFSVVAQEVRSLAEQAAKATADISELIGAILSGVRRATASVSAASEQVSKSVAITNRTENVFREIAAASMDNETKIEGILSRTDGMLDISQEVQQAMTELTRLNQEHGVAVEETTTAVMEMSGEINEIGQAARLLKEMGQSQEDQLSQFILE